MFQTVLQLLLLILLLVTTMMHGSNAHERKAYIVYMGELPAAETSVMDVHHNLLLTAIGDEKVARESKIHSYKKSFNGFAARLLPHEVKRISDEEGVVSVFPNTLLKLHTTRSWDFLGMPNTFKGRNFAVESNIIVGLLDTGIWVGAPSFSDKGYGPVPAKWKGKCVTGGNFTGCSRKVIGARYFNLEGQDPGTKNPSPFDDDGHGTHTSSTLAGIHVEGASLYDIAKGTARGGVPSARIAMYKVCWTMGCSDMDLLAGFDHAIADGVDLISVSIGGPPRNLFEDSIAIGAFHAMKKGILTSCSAGNDGPYTSTVQNIAPWIMTVAASGIDRQFTTVATLGSGSKFSGIAINTFSPKRKMYPLTSGALAANTSGETYGNASACDYGTLSKDKVKGKIVFCMGNLGQDYTIKELGGAGAIMALDERTDIAFTTLVPGTCVIPSDGKRIEHYINSTKNPLAAIEKTKTYNISAPFVASFSSRGPPSIPLNILKEISAVSSLSDVLIVDGQPDIAAPGLDILAAFSKLATITGDPGDKRHAVFNIISGTSMACPHAAAAAAYVKSFHPDWSPAAIKSALMTTATPMKIKEEDAELGSGSGQINPTKAVHPGLIYDISISSYIGFLCKQGYNSTTIGIIAGGHKKYDCSKFQHALGTDGLNYPTLNIQLKTNSSRILATFHRTVTNVGYGKSVYKAKVTSPRRLSVRVFPETLKFNSLHQKLSFKVVVKGSLKRNGTQLISALLEWKDIKHRVKSHILVYRRH